MNGLNTGTLLTLLSGYFALPTGVTPGGIALAFLEFCTVIMFAIGGLYYYRLTKLISTKKKQVLALCGAISCFVGGLPNAVDKLSWAIAQKDLWFNSVWMFFFVGIGYVLLFISSLVPKGECQCGQTGENTKRDRLNAFALPVLFILLSFASPSFHKPMKYLAMLSSCVGMLGFYITMFIRAKKVIGARAYLYFVTMGMTMFLVVFGAAAKFDALWPNMLAQTCNNLGYFALILANKYYIKALEVKQ